MSSVEPGWYPDANDSSLIRWWDGNAWTEHTRPLPAEQAESAPAESAPAASVPAASVPADSAPAASSPGARTPSLPVSEPVRLMPPVSSSFPISEPVRLVPPTSPVAESAPSGWPSPEPAAQNWSGAEPSRRNDSGSFAVTPLATAPPAPASASTPWTSSSSSFAQPAGSVDLASVDYEPMERTWSAARGASTRTVTGVTTGGVWMLALSPLLQLGLLALGWFLTDGGTSSSTSVIGASLGFALLAWIIIATILDYRRLGALGHEFRPSVLWILVGPLMYLIARSIHVQRTSGKGVAPAWVYALLTVVVAASAAAGSLAVPREASTTELRQVESRIVADLQREGIDVSVICPDTVTISAGSTFICTGYDEVGPVLLFRVTYGGVPGAFSFVVESNSARP